MLKRLFVILFLAFASMNAHALEYTDVYYNPAEPGWGVFLVQSDTTQFLAFFIYGPDGKPTWYTAQLTEDANGNYVGPLYAITGTYFANPWQGYNIAAVGTASFEPSDSYHATLRYSFTGGPTVVKPIERQSLTPYPLAGSYSGSMSGTISGCQDPIDNEAHFRGRFNLTVTKTADTASTLVFSFVDTDNNGIVCSVAGPLTHLGRLYKIANGTFACTGQGINTSPVPGTLDGYHPTGQGIEGRLTASTGDGCKASLRFAAVLNNCGRLRALLRTAASTRRGGEAPAGPARAARSRVSAAKKTAPRGPRRRCGANPIRPRTTSRSPRSTGRSDS